MVAPEIHRPTSESMHVTPVTLSSPPYLRGELPRGQAAARKTLRIMRHMVRECKTDLGLRNLAMSLVRDLPQRDIAAQARVLHAWVRDRIRYIGDIDGVETLHTPRQIVVQGQGDCDDKSLLLATLLASIGQKTRFVALGYGPAVSHVMVETRIGNNWVPLETTENVGAGWYPSNINSRIVVHN